MRALAMIQLDISKVTCARESIAVVSSGTGAVLTTCNNQLSAVSYLQDLNLYTFTCTGEPISGVSSGTGTVVTTWNNLISAVAYQQDLNLYLYR